jgi:histidinol phosphatase-like PHP family hydrolase
MGADFRLLQGIEANIDARGNLDPSDDEAATFDVVLAAPHQLLAWLAGPANLARPCDSHPRET